MTTLLHQFTFEQRTSWRAHPGSSLHLRLPLLLYALLGSVYSDEIEGDPAVHDVLLAGLLGYGAVNTAFGGLAIILVGRREAGAPEAPAGDTARPGTYIGALLLSFLLLFALQARRSARAGRLAFGASIPRELARLRRRHRPRVAAFAGWGSGRPLSSVVDGVSAVVNVITLRWPSSRDRFGPTDEYPAFLQAIADVLPLTYFIDVVNNVYLDGESLFADLGALAVVGAWGAAGLAVALRRFSWMPRER